MKRLFLSAFGLLVIAGCSRAETFNLAAGQQEVALTPASGAVRLLDIRQGHVHLEATCDMDTSAACGVAAAQWCASAPSVYDQQRYQISAQGESRQVWLASCRPRLTV